MWAGGRPFHSAQTNAVEFPGTASLRFLKGAGFDATSREPLVRWRAPSSAESRHWHLFKKLNFQWQIRQGPAGSRYRLRSGANSEYVDATAAVPACIDAGPVERSATGNGLLHTARI